MKNQVSRYRRCRVIMIRKLKEKKAGKEGQRNVEMVRCALLT